MYSKNDPEKTTNTVLKKGKHIWYSTNKQKCYAKMAPLSNLLHNFQHQEKQLCMNEITPHKKYSPKREFES